ncbi:MAG: hypothetical protein ABSF10_12445 [Verrucomicrobiota bacterium]|jgi:hypothetical protein
MKKNLVWLILLFMVVVIVVLVFYKSSKLPLPASEARLPFQEKPVSTNYSLPNQQTQPRPFTSNQVVQQANQTAASRTEFLKRELESKNVPVSFYGRVVDQEGNGIAGVKILMHVRQWHLDTTVDRWGNKFPKFERVTDLSGNFSLEDTTGDSLSIESVSKEGYRLSPKAPNIFGYGSGNVPAPFHPDPQNPVIIQMWKLGEPANLISHRTLFGFEPDGRIYTLDLIADQKIASGNVNGDLRVQFQRQSILKPKEKYPWALEISAVDGGLAETTDEFEYVAPENGYQPKISFQTNSISPKAMPDITRDYYFTSRNGQVYGVVSMQFFSDYNGQSAILVNSRVNPNGSRNLQP